MNTNNTTKINQLLSSQPPGIVLQSGWLVQQSYSTDLQKRYRQSQWLRSIGIGAMIRATDRVDYTGAIYALQEQSALSVHPACKTALALLGKAHYLELATKKVTVFGDLKETLPVWFLKHDWGMAIDFHTASFLPPDIGKMKVELKNFSIKVSGAARAMLECLYLAPDDHPLMECYVLMEGLNDVQPGQAQELLEQCRSIKVKRLFLYLAEKAGHNWFQYLNIERINLGKGKRSLAKNGVYIDTYQITVPKELALHGTSV